MRKLAKLRRDPILFFEDAKSPWVRRAGGALARRVLARPSVHRALLDPLEAAAASHLAPVRAIAARIDAGMAARRRRRFQEAGWPLVSVIMAARNAEATIDAAVDSVLAQTYRELELVVIDDASTDGTAARVAAIAKRDRRVRMEHDPRPRGAAHARNIGLSVATGDYLTFQDADDRSLPTRIERQLDELLTHPSAAFSVCNYRRVDADGRTVRINRRTHGKCIVSVLFGRRVLERVGYLRSLPVGEDAEYYERIKAAFGEDAERALFATLYEARFSPRSLLFSDGVTEVRGENVTHAPSPEAAASRDEWSAWHRRIVRGEESPYVSIEP